MKRFELMPTDGRKSFSGKARVEESQTMATLYSYEVPICTLIFATGELQKTPDWNFSATTKRHQKAFLAFYGIDA